MHGMCFVWLLWGAGNGQTRRWELQCCPSTCAPQKWMIRLPRTVQTPGMKAGMMGHERGGSVTPSEQRYTIHHARPAFRLKPAQCCPPQSSSRNVTVSLLSQDLSTA